MGAETGGIDPGEVERQFAERLHHVAVQKDAPFLAAGRDFRHRLDDAGFVVRGHDRYQDRLGTDRLLEFVGIDQAVRRKGEPGHLKAFSFRQMFERVKDRVMFGPVADQVLSVRRSAPGETEQGKIVRFRPAARENDFVRSCA